MKNVQDLDSRVSKSWTYKQENCKQLLPHGQ